ncbi:MAG: helix-turn-helix transcriptional regulator [Bacteroidales bacterium]|nr:helix-turn-helix transcriptional regulator [Bacteroidales bacterium]
MKTKQSSEANLASRITKIRDYFCNGNNIEFAERMGDHTSNTSAYCNGTKNASLKVLYRIADAFPEVDKTWLVFGEGNMLAVENHNETSASNALVNNGINNGVQKQDNTGDCMAEIKRLIGIIDRNATSMASKDQQISELIAMVKPTA